MPSKNEMIERAVKKVDTHKHAKHLITEIAAGRDRIFAQCALPFGWRLLEREGLATPTVNDRAALTRLGLDVALVLRARASTPSDALKPAASKLVPGPADTAPDWKAVAAIGLEGCWSNDPAENARELVDTLTRYRGHLKHDSVDKMIGTLTALGFHTLAATVVHVLQSFERPDAGEVLVRAELAKQGLRRANVDAGEAGWFVTVRVGAVTIKVWATDEG
jgi:hypothetical protein